MVLVDTCVWSLALRRRHATLSAAEADVVTTLEELIAEGRVVIIGSIRQELLSGVRDATQFERLRARLRAFVDEPLSEEDHEEAARCHNACRQAGLTGHAIDMLICAVAIRGRCELFTVDADFRRFATCLPLRLHDRAPRPAPAP